MSEKTPDDGTQDPYAQAGYPPPPGPAQPPAYGQQPPAYGQFAPGQQPPVPGQPAYGQQGPGQQPPAFEKPATEQPYSAPGQYSTGGYPPPGSAYPPPSAPPISAGQYGAPESPVPDGFRYGWQKLTENFGAILVAVIAYLAVFTVVGVVFFSILLGAGSVSDGNAAAAGLGFGSIVFVLVIIVLGMLAQAGIIRGALAITHGRRVTVGDFFTFSNFGPVVLTILLIGFASAILSFTFIGALLVGFFSQFALFFVIDKGLGVIDAIKASVRLVLDNISTAVLLFVFVYLATALGAVALLVGLIIAVPVSIIASAYVYRKLINEQPV